MTYPFPSLSRLTMKDKIIRIGWSEVDITPEKLPVNIAGQFYARVSEGVADPLKATALAIEADGEQVVFVAIDAVYVSDPLRDAVRAQIHEVGLDPQKVILNATHTHEGASNGGLFQAFEYTKEAEELGINVIDHYIKFAAGRIADAVRKAWQGRAEGGIAFGQDYAVVGRNRRWVDKSGQGIMYRLNASTAESFDFIEGYEDHSINLLATYNADNQLTGIVVNIPSPSQESESSYEMSADYWYEARRELRARFGENIFILPQCSAAGELTSHLIYDQKAHARMLELRGRSAREEVAQRIADSVGRILPYLPSTIDRSPVLHHHYETLQLPLNKLSQADVEDAQKNAEHFRAEYEAERQKLLDNPDLKKEPRWYVPVSVAFNRSAWYRGVVERFDSMKTQPTYPAEIHVLRLGDLAIATNPFEYYLDFGVQIKVKSPAIQTFIVQLAGSGTYIPSRRAASYGGYGAVPASNPVGAEGGQILADKTVDIIRSLWKEDK